MVSPEGTSRLPIAGRLIHHWAAPDPFGEDAGPSVSVVVLRMTLKRSLVPPRKLRRASYNWCTWLCRRVRP